MAKYEGLIGKLSQDIFEGSGQGNLGVAKYAGLGSLAGAGVGGTQGYLSEEGSFQGGLVRGALAGAGIGAATNYVPKAISSTLKKSGLNVYGEVPELAEAASTAFRPLFDSMNTTANKDLLSSFQPTIRENVRSINKPHKFAKDSAMDVIKKAENPQDLTNLQNIGKDVVDNLESFNTTNIQGIKFKNYIDSSVDSFQGLSKGDRRKTAGSFTAVLGFDSAYKHIVEPTGDFIKKTRAGQSTSMMEKSAAAFSLFGAYEAAQVTGDISEGNWGAAAGGFAMLAGSKLAFSQGVNAIHANKFLKEKGISASDLAKTTVAGYGVKQLFTGFNKFTPEDHFEVNSAIQTKLKTAVI